MTRKGAAHPHGPVLVVGGINADVLGRSLQPAEPHTSNPARVQVTPGGVGRNIAETLARLGAGRVRLLGAVGADLLGESVLSATARAGVDVAGVQTLAGQTGTYLAVLDAAGELLLGLADMNLTDALTPDLAAHWAAELGSARLLILDANLPAHTIRLLLDAAGAAGVPAVLEPVSAPKAARLPRLEGVFLLTPDRAELAALAGLGDLSTAEALAQAAERLHAQGVGHLLLTLGAEGSVLYSPGQPPLHTPALPAAVQDVTGAGDALVAGVCAGLLRGLALPQAVRVGHACAALTVGSDQTVRADLSWAAVMQLLARPLDPAYPAPETP